MQIENPDIAYSDTSSQKQARQPQTKHKERRKGILVIESPLPKPVPIPKTEEEMVKDAEDEEFYLRTYDFWQQILAKKKRRSRTKMA